jgi:hypothetical protein
MKADYLLRVLGHFHSEAATAVLAGDCRVAISDLNVYSVGLLRTICRCAAHADSAEDIARTNLANDLSAERRAFDDTMRRRMDSLIREIRKGASTRRPPL